MEENKYPGYCARILRGIGIEPGDDFMRKSFAMNEYVTKEFTVEGAKVSASITAFGYKNPVTVRIEVNFSLPEEGVLADTFMDHCAAIEKTPTNHHHEYCSGPTYPDYLTELRGRRQTFAISPWNDRYFYVRSNGYYLDEIDEAICNAVSLARQFASHLKDLPSLRYWKTTDKEVVDKAREIVRNAAFQETDCDRETKGHWLVDRNSFFKGWFYPFNDGGNGTFDTLFYSDIAAIGVEGSFEYAVSSLLLHDPDYIAKARKACWIREYTCTVRF